MSQLIDFIKRFNDLGLEALFLYIVNWIGILLPITKAPIIKQIFQSYLKKRLVELKENVETSEFSLITSILVSDQLKQYLKEIEENLKAQENGTDEQKQIAQMELIKKASDFIKFKLP